MIEIKARTRLEATVINADLIDPIADGTAFETLIDGDPSQDEPEVQELTQDDGSLETADDDQALLMDDIVPQ